MTAGISTFEGMAVPLAGESEIKAVSTTLDVLTITGASGGTGDLLVLRQADGTEVFAVDKDGAVVCAGTVTANDVVLTGAS